MYSPQKRTLVFINILICCLLSFVTVSTGEGKTIILSGGHGGYYPMMYPMFGGGFHKGFGLSAGISAGGGFGGGGYGGYGK